MAVVWLDNLTHSMYGTYAWIDPGSTTLIGESAPLVVSGDCFGFALQYHFTWKFA